MRTGSTGEIKFDLRRETFSVLAETLSPWRHKLSLDILLVLVFLFVAGHFTDQTNSTHLPELIKKGMKNRKYINK